MLSSVLAAVTCAAIPVTDPLQIAAQTTPGEASVEVGNHVTPTSFRSRNFSAVDQLLVFGTSDHSVEPTIVVLHPGAVVQYEFSQQALNGLLLEVVSVRDGHLTTSGAHSLALPATQCDMCLWMMTGSDRLTTWQQLGCEVTRMASQDTLLPDGWTDDSGTESAMSAPPCAVPLSPPRIPPPQDNAPYTPM